MAVATLYRVATSREDTVMRPPRCVLNKGLIERQPENWVRFGAPRRRIWPSSIRINCNHCVYDDIRYYYYVWDPKNNAA
jgi:hypothetical protein